MTDQEFQAEVLQRFEALDQRFDRLEKKVDDGFKEMGRQFDLIADQFAHLTPRVTGLETNTT